MRRLIIFFMFISVLLFSQSNKDIKKYEKIFELIQQEDLEKAKEETLKLLKKNNKWKKPHLLMSSIYEKEGKILESVDEYLQVYDLESKNNAHAIFILAERLYKHAYYKEALEYFIISENLFEEKNKHERYILNCEFALLSIKNPVYFNPINMGEVINSDSPEYLPYISANGEELIITRRVLQETKKEQEDLFISKIDQDSLWSTAVPMLVNTDLNEGAVTISSDKRFLIYTACDRIDGFGSCDLYVCVRDKNGYWSDAINLGNQINTRYWESQASFSPDGKYLYFVSNRRGGFGGNDIWRSELTSFGFSNPENMGQYINTTYNEMSPFPHHDNLTFYFASDGHVGMGDFDVFVSRRNNTDASWSPPINLGYPINSNKVENSLVVGPDGKTAYFTSNQSGFGLEDIFYFELQDENRASKITDLEIDIITQASGSEIVLNNVFFETDSYVLSNASFDELNILFEYLTKNSSISIHIQGHTDNVGGFEYNQILSEKRAEEVYKYLINQGVSADRVTYKGYGENNPLFSNDTIEGRMKNRRTSFFIIP